MGGLNKERPGHWSYDLRTNERPWNSLDGEGITYIQTKRHPRGWKLLVLEELFYVGCIQKEDLCALPNHKQMILLKFP